MYVLLSSSRGRFMTGVLPRHLLEELPAYFENPPRIFGRV